MTERELDEILTIWWPCVLRRVMAGDGDEWARGFARSISRHGKRPSWKPSAKQASIMRQMVQELSAPAGELELIER